MDPGLESQVCPLSVHLSRGIVLVLLAQTRGGAGSCQGGARGVGQHSPQGLGLSGLGRSPVQGQLPSALLVRGGPGWFFL